MSRRKRGVLLGLATGLLVVASGFQLSRRFFEMPDYKILAHDGHFEIREYGARIVAETVVERLDQESALSEGFRRLADYIFGANISESKGTSRIAMTTPVEATPTSNTRIAMTTPVEATSQPSGGWTVTFTMPSKYTLETLPKPKDPRVLLRRRDGDTVAVLRFSGHVDDTVRRSREAELLRAVQSAGYVATGPVTIAIYDPPSVVLSIFRRNELIVPVRRDSPPPA
jgi:hypothetical protein